MYFFKFSHCYINVRKLFKFLNPGALKRKYFFCLLGYTNADSHLKSNLQSRNRENKREEEDGLKNLHIFFIKINVN